MRPLLLFFCLVSATAFAQPGRVDTFPGTKHTIVLPEGFEVAGRGFKDFTRNIYIYISEDTALPYDKVKESFSDDFLRRNNLTFDWSHSLYLISDLEGFIIKIRSRDEGRINPGVLSQNFVMGNQSRSVVVRAEYFDDLPAIGSLVRRTLLSFIAYDEKEQVLFAPDVRKNSSIVSSVNDQGLLWYRGELFTVRGEIDTLEVDYFLFVDKDMGAKYDPTKKDASPKMITGADLYPDFGHSVYSLRVSCYSGQYQLIDVKHYDKKGKPIVSKGKPDTDFSLYPDMASHFVQTVCAGTPFRNNFY